jgi:membrane protein CcdC involved in cytochrome C biogenesis
MRYDPIKELNDEVERDLVKPFVLIPVVIITVVLLLGTVIHFKEEIDAFSMKHPIILAFCFIIPGTIGWYFFGKKNRLW